MNGWLNEALALAESLVAPAGLTCTMSRGAKHPIIEVSGHGLRHKFALSGTPRDREYQMRYTRQQVTAWLEKNGLAEKRGSPGEAPKPVRRARAGRSAVAAPELGPATRLASNPFDVLAGRFG